MNHIELLSVLEDAYKRLNAYLAKDSLPEDIVLIVSPVGKRPKYGHFHGDSWMTTEGETKHEILLAGEYLIERDALGVLETLVHEMAHLANHVAGIKYCHSATQYHNKKFKVKAEEFGLTVVKTRKGWAETDLTSELKGWLVNEGIVNNLTPLVNIAKKPKLGINTNFF